MAATAKTMTADLDKAIEEMNKRHGRGALMTLVGDGHRVPVLPSGSLAVDIATTVGGLPYGRIIEIFGAESSGKTTLALHAVAQAQRAGLAAAFIDAEHAISPGWLRDLGVDLSKLVVAQPDCGEQALQIAEQLMGELGFRFIVVDSVSALIPQSELNGKIGDQHVGTQARLMSQAMRKLVGTAKRTNSIVIFINQIRMKIGVMMGSPKTTSGGNALKFAASIRMEVTRIGSLEGKLDAVGGKTILANKIKVETVKNKVGPPRRVAETAIYFGAEGMIGFDRLAELVELGQKLDLIEKSGSWLTYGELRAQGAMKLRAALLEAPEIADRLENEVRAKARIPLPTAEGELASIEEAAA